MTIKVFNNGPLRIEGDEIALTDHSGVSYGLGGRTGISLCRCGLSEKKPFCDGSHARQSFQSECAAYDLPPKAGG